MGNKEKAVLNNSDQEYINIERKKRKEKYNSIVTGMYVKDEIIKFDKRRLYENVEAYLPENFFVLPKELAEQKYLSSDRPDLIFSDASTTVNMAFKYLNVELYPEQLKELVLSTKETMKRLNSSRVFYNDYNKLENISFCGYDYKEQVIDGELYYMIFYGSIDKKMFFMMFHCIYDDAAEWNPVFLNVAKSVSEQERQDNE